MISLFSEFHHALGPGPAATKGENSLRLRGYPGSLNISP